MHSSLVSLVLISVMVAVFAEPQFRNYPAQYFRQPAGLRPYQAPQYQYDYAAPQDINSRILFLETTIFTTTTSISVKSCRYSTAVLAACPTRKRRSVLLAGEDEEEFAPTVVLSVTPTQEATAEQVREKRQSNLRQVEPANIESSFVPRADIIPVVLPTGGRLFLNINTITSTTTSTITNTASTLVTCAPLTGFANAQC